MNGTQGGKGQHGSWRPWYWLVLILALANAVQAAEEKDPLAGAQRHEGFLPLYYQAATGKALLAVTRMDEPLIYQTALVSGVGSNDIGLDRGQLGPTRLVRFRRAGNRVLLLQDNLNYRAQSDDAQERRAVEEAFATSVLASLEVVSQVEGVPVVDLSPLLFDDSHGISDRLTMLQQGQFSLDAGSSAVFPEHLLSFPRNSIVQVLLSYRGKNPGPWVAQVAPTPERIAVTYSHQFAALPEPGYQPRAYHPRSGFFDLNYWDYAAPLGEALQQRWLVRHRLEWRDANAHPAPGQALPVREPIVYYLDPGTPEPIRSALMEGASWWAEAFAAAGFADAFRVELLPANAHPLDLRYNVIQWVHRATRGWSYGAAVVDPRNGEIIKGHVTLGSLRVRQDMLIAEALTAPFVDGVAVSSAAREMALARLRQLAAHEVGHTLGLSHNFAASSIGDASVMDYPHPNLKLGQDGRVKLDQAYAVGMSPWDRWAIRYGYTPFAANEEADALKALLDEADSAGLLFSSDPDARVPGSPYARANLWDNGEDSVKRLQELLTIRQLGLDQFSTQVLAPGRPLFELEQRLVPVYLLHRYQVEAVAKQLGGLYYDHRLRGEHWHGVKAVSGAQQQVALSALLDSLSSARLQLPAPLLNLIPPPAEGYARDRENFTHATSPSFDHLAPPRAAIDLVYSELTQAARAARINDQHLVDESLPDYAWLLAQVERSLFDDKANSSYARAITAERRQLWVEKLQPLLVGSNGRIRAQVDQALRQLAKRLQKERKDPQAQYLARQIEQNLSHTNTPVPALPAVVVPPGSPIGS